MTKDEKHRLIAHPHGNVTDDLSLDDLIALAIRKGGEEEFLEWLRKQPSAASGHSDWIDGEPLCEAAHWRSARYCGIACKPEYLAVPLRNAEHGEQHRNGQYRFRPREWWAEKAEHYLRLWLTS